ncbi:hypothetical protein FRB99_008974 [Tulasnella sp. 403]|nr:hypothetical protein FRB99_008974 [Tulasnella sp. 403]
MAGPSVPPTLLLALSSATIPNSKVTSSPSSSFSRPTPSSAYIVNLSRANTPSSANNTPDRRDSLADAMMMLPPSPPNIARALGSLDSSDRNTAHRRRSQNSDDSPRHGSDELRISEDDAGRTSNYNCDSLSKPTNGRLFAVSEAGEHSNSRRGSRTSTFGQGDSGPATPEPSILNSGKPSTDRRPSPSFRDELLPSAAGRFSVADSDALRRQSLRTGRPSRDGPKDLLQTPPSEKQELTRTSDDIDVRPVSGSYRLTLKTTNESTNGYTGYGSSNGHSEYKKTHPHIPRSSYYVGPPAVGSAFGTEPLGEIGTHFPREIVRIERDYSGGELVQFYPTYPLEFEGRITPTKFQASINEINEVLISAYSLRYSALENVLGIVTLYLSTLLFETHYDKEMRRLARLFDRLNKEVYNPVGLNLLWPRKVGFLFLEIEYF